MKNRLAYFAFVLLATAASSAPAAATAHATCITIGGSMNTRFEVREIRDGKPAKLTTSKNIKVKMKGPGWEASSWCVSEKGVTYVEPGDRQNAEIRFFMPFDVGFAHQTTHSRSGKYNFPVEITGLARKYGDTITVNYQYTMGSKLTHARFGKMQSLRIEESFQFVLSGGSCKMNYFKFTRVTNGGDIVLGGLHVGHYYGMKSTDSKTHCRAVSAHGS